jgi:hypothetical protein
MKKTIHSEVMPTKFLKVPEVMVDGFIIVQGDLVKIAGERGSKFRFHTLTKNLDTGSEWVDCFETSRNQVGVIRSFGVDKIKRIPQKGKRAKRVND